MLRRTLISATFKRTLGTLIGPPIKPPTDDLDNLPPGALAPKERSLVAFVQDKLSKAKKDAELTKDHGVRGAIDRGMAESAKNWEEAAARQAAINQALADKSPSSKLRDSITGRYDPNDHFLLMDLDIDKDAALFGSTREEFYANVEKLKEVIIEYYRWERRDGFYYYGTWVAKIMSLILLYDAWEQERLKVLMASSMDNFRRSHEESLTSLERRRLHALEMAVLELEVRPPNFEQLVKERAAMEQKSLEERKMAYKQHPMDTLGLGRAEFEATVERQDTLVRLGLSPTSVPAIVNIRRILLPQSDDWAVVVREEMMEYKLAKARQLEYPDKETSLGRVEPLGLRQQKVLPIIGATT